MSVAAVYTFSHITSSGHLVEEQSVSTVFGERLSVPADVVALAAVGIKHELESSAWTSVFGFRFGFRCRLANYTLWHLFRVDTLIDFWVEEEGIAAEKKTFLKTLFDPSLENDLFKPLTL